jgi:Periplasmic component of the Tol biopolymer transport system
MPLRCIPIEELFANPAIAQVNISPDGNFLAWLAPRNGHLNIWLHDRATGSGRFLTDERERSIHTFAWGNSRTIVFARDTNGDENYQIYLLDIDSENPPTLCTPPQGVRAEILSTLPLHDDRILITHNGRAKEGYRARIRNHGHSCFLCEIVIRSQFHTTYEPEA